MSSTQLSYLLNNKCLVKNFNKNISVISSYSVCFSYTLLSTHFQKVNLFLYCIDKMNNFHNNHNTVITDCFAKHTPEHLLFFSILCIKWLHFLSICKRIWKIHVFSIHKKYEETSSSLQILLNEGPNIFKAEKDVQVPCKKQTGSEEKIYICKLAKLVTKSQV